MDCTEEYIWQRRIHHGVRHQKGAVPFPESVQVGLEFNAALERKEKLDLCLLTNAVMLELCGFAKTVTKSESYFLFEMIEFNFDLGVDVDDDLQCYDYAKRVHSKIKLLKEQIKMKPRRFKETFPLPDLSSIIGPTGSEQPGRYYPKKNKIADSSVLTDGSKYRLSSENQKAESNGAASSAFIIKKSGRVRLKLACDVYPFCKELGVRLVVRPENVPKEKLHSNLLTNGVMMELLDFSKVLCGKHTQIVSDLVKQNFGQELDRILFRMQLTKVMERKYTCLTGEDRDAFLKQPFKVQTERRGKNYKKRNPEADNQELETQTVAIKRRATLRQSDAKELWQESDLSYMCPVDFETEHLSGTEAGPAETMFERGLLETAASTKSPVSVDIKEEEEEVFVSPVQPQLNGHSAHSITDLFSEDTNEDMSVKTPKQKLWMRRASRSKQILKSSRVNDMFARCREIGLDFNVGSGNKQNLDLQLFTNCVLWEVYKFASGMTKSLRSFLFDILDNNFNLLLQDELHQRNFIFYIITKERLLQNHPDRQKVDFLNSPFQFPEVYNMVDATMDFESAQEVESEQQTNSDLAAWATSPEAGKESHPFCGRLGLNLWATEGRPGSQKLDLSFLTTGAVREIFSHVRELCGSVRQVVNDVLEHNFDLDLQSGATEAAQVIQRWYETQRSFMERQHSTQKINRWLNAVVPLNGCSQKPLSGNSFEDLEEEEEEEDLKPDFKMEAFSGNMQQVERVNDYHVCKEIGLVLDVGSQPGDKTKLDLRMLTRGVLFEMHQYVEQNCQRYVPALYEILEYNFDLSSQSHRRVEFAWSIASQVIAIARKTGRKADYRNKVFELPFEVSESSHVVCKEEPEDGFGKLDLKDDSDVVFVRQLKPVDIEVEIE